MKALLDLITVLAKMSIEREMNIKISNPFLQIIMKLYSHQLVIKYLQNLMIVIK